MTVMEEAEGSDVDQWVTGAHPQLSGLMYRPNTMPLCSEHRRGRETYIGIDLWVI